MAPASIGYPSLDPRRMSNYYPEAVLSSSADLDLELASRLYMQRANSLPAASDKTDGEQSDANRRLMERLMDQTSVPIDSFLHQSVASEAMRRQSFQASRMVTAPTPAASSPPVSLSAIHHESFKTKRLSPPSTAATTSPMPSLYGARDFILEGVHLQHLPLDKGCHPCPNYRLGRKILTYIQHLCALKNWQEASVPMIRCWRATCTIKSHRHYFLSLDEV